MKKKQIGFISVNDCKAKNTEENSNKEHSEENETIPPHVINEIEEHVLAKQEYEQSMHTLYMFKLGLKTLGYIFLAVLFGAAVYVGYICGCNKTEAMYKEQAELYQKFERVYNQGVKDGAAKVKFSNKHHSNKKVSAETK